MLRRAAPHNWLNLALEAPHLVPPVLATGLVSATGGASFYAAWTMLSFLYIAPFHLGTVLYATGSARPHAAAKQLRFTLRLSLLAGLAGIPALMLIGPWVLGLFGPSYRDLGSAPLRLLAVGYVPMVVIAHFVALCRMRRRITFAAGVLTVGGLVELGAAAVGALTGGLVGLAVGLVAGKLFQCALTARTVWRALTAARPRPAERETSSTHREVHR
jgi:O-antigen/teichoic acid export membrane protein